MSERVEPCWCGEREPLFNDEYLDGDCGGTGVLHCWCAGDFCACHFHGEEECLGCESCDDPYTYPADGFADDEL